MQNKPFASFLVWLLSVALILPAPIFATGFASGATSDEDPIPPVAIHLDGANPTTGENISVTLSEASDPKGVTKLVQLAESAVAETAKTGGKTVVLTVANPGAEGFDPNDETLADLGVKIGSVNPRGSEVIHSELDKQSQDQIEKLDKIKDAEGERSHHFLNTVLTITRIAGIAIGVTTIVSLTKGIPFLHALPIGFVAASMSGGLQAINGSFQRWLVGKGFFRIPALGEAPAHHGVTIGKLSLVSLTYLSILRGGLYAMGLEPGSFFSLENAKELGTSVALGTVMEYAWDRFISESLALKLREEPHQKWRHLMIADSRAALISIIGTAAQALSVAGFTLGHVAAGVITGIGVISYVWSTHGDTIIEATKQIAKTTVGACKLLFFKIAG